MDLSLALALLLLTPTPAPAALPVMVELPSEPPPPRPPVTSSPRRPATWYGWQTLLAGGAADLLVLLGTSTKAPPIAWIGLMELPLTGAVVHDLHGETGRGYASFGLGLALAAAGGVIDVAVRCSGMRGAAGCGASEALRGAFLGANAAVLVDAFGLAWARAHGTRPSQSGGVKLAPSFAFAPGASTLGIVGGF
jgi:hypothetical protein